MIRFGVTNHHNNVFDVFCNWLSLSKDIATPMFSMFDVYLSTDETSWFMSVHDKLK